MKGFISLRKMTRLLLVISLLIHCTVEAQLAKPNPNVNPDPRPGGGPGPKPVVPRVNWQTLNGEPPLIVARGGFSGFYPENSIGANLEILPPFSIAGSTILYCNMQLSKDEKGICLTNLALENTTTNYEQILGDKATPRNYEVNGKEVHGYFAIDYPAAKLVKLGLKQALISRPLAFEGLTLSTVEDIGSTKLVPLWINVEYDLFYVEHNLSPLNYIEATMNTIEYAYISSPEVGFMKAISGKVDKTKTKLIFKLKGEDEVEPTTKEKYSELVKDLASIKEYASGILVPKHYIWPVNSNLYLMDATTLVEDAHTLGMEVYAYNFANDYVPTVYNYSYDPSLEYLQFIDNKKFSVDGVLTDFPPTASAAISCFAHVDVSATPKKEQILIMTHNGASGNYPGCTDVAYEKAVEDGADIIDCNVQMSKDGVAFCMDSADLSETTTALNNFMSRAATIHEIKESNGEKRRGSGIFTFDLTWKEIQTLEPVISNPYEQVQMFRNPAFKNAGKFVTLDEFLKFAKTKPISGILVSIQNAAYLASKKGLDIVGTVRKSLRRAAYDKQTKQQVMIMSDATSVLKKFKRVPPFKRVLQIADLITDAPKAAVAEVKKYADAVTLREASILPDYEFFSMTPTKIIREMQDANISVYVGILKNEFTSILFDYYSDPSHEMAVYASLGVNGMISEYPATVNKFLRRGCDKNSPYAMLAVAPGGTGDGAAAAYPEKQPRGPPPTPLEVSDIVDQPLPKVKKDSKDSNGAPAPGESASSSSKEANPGIPLLAILGLTLLFH